MTIPPWPCWRVATLIRFPTVAPVSLPAKERVVGRIEGDSNHLYYDTAWPNRNYTQVIQGFVSRIHTDEKTNHRPQPETLLEVERLDHHRDWSRLRVPVDASSGAYADIKVIQSSRWGNKSWKHIDSRWLSLILQSPPDRPLRAPIDETSDAYIDNY